MYKTWNVEKYEGDTLENIQLNFSSPIFKNNKKYDLYLNLTDSSMNKINTDKKININCKNIVFEGFIGSLEFNIYHLYIPLFIAMKTTINNVYIIRCAESPKKKIGKNQFVIYKITKSGKLIKLTNLDIDIKKIDTFVDRHRHIHKKNFFNKDFGFYKIFNNYIPKNIISLNLGNGPLITKTQFVQPNINNYILYRGICPYKSNYLWKNAKPWNQKKNYLIYPGTFNGNFDKNQLRFVKLLDKDSLKDYTLLFTGVMSKRGNKSYLNSVESLLKKKKINYKMGCLTDNIDVFMDSLLQCKGLIFYGVHSYDRVRVLTEGLFANLPFIVNNAIKTIPNLYLKCGFKVKNNDKKDLNDKIKKLIEKDWGIEPMQLTKKYFQIDKLAEGFVNQINIITK